MSRFAPAALETLIDRLHDGGRLRVWSLVVTIFGDAIVPRGGSVQLAVLQELVARLRVEPGALRTALSRLAADGWVTRERDGRTSSYTLDRHGLHAFDQATRRIYAGAAPFWDGRFTVALGLGGKRSASTPQKQALAEAGFVAAGSGWVRPETFSSPDLPSTNDFLMVTGTVADLPRDFSAVWGLDDLAGRYQGFSETLGPMAQALEAGDRLAPLDALAARILLIHAWRRLVLHDPGLPEALLPRAWPGTEARGVAAGIYRDLTDASERWLDSAGLPPLEDADAFARRFGGE